MCINKNFWGIFHDGYIIEILRIGECGVVLKIKIPYLRKMFEDAGEYFYVRLSNCSKLVFRPWGESETNDFEKIAELSPEILYIKTLDPFILDCSNGELEISYSEARVQLDSEREIKYEELVSMCEKYWSDWEAKATEKMIQDKQ